MPYNNMIASNQRSKLRSRASASFREPHPVAAMAAAGVASCAAAARRMAASGGAGKMASQVASTRSRARRSPGRASQMAPNTCRVTGPDVSKVWWPCAGATKPLQP